MKMASWSRGIIALNLVTCGGFTLDANAALIASDSFLAGTGGYPNGTNLYQNTSTAGTTGYDGGWTYNTSAIVANTASALTHPFASPASGSQGGLYFPGVGVNGTRSQTRLLATYNQTASDYYISALMSSSTSFTTGTAVLGLTGSITTTALPSSGLQVGFTGGGNIELFYKNSLGAFTSATLLSGYTAGQAYMFVIHLNTAEGTVGANLYNSSGAVVGSVSNLATLTNLSTDMARLAGAVSSDFSSGSPSVIRFDEFRFGTQLSDVIPEPSALALFGIGAVSLLRRKRHH